MCTNIHHNKFPTRQGFDLHSPQPGEIWEVSRCVQSPVEFSLAQQQLYSEAAMRFLNGESPPRYAIVVNEPDPLTVVSVMVMSAETNFLSDVNLLIPKEVSGVEQDLLALTWHVLPMLTCNLLLPVGVRLSREVYDALMNVGDYHLGLIDEAPSPQEIQALGLAIGANLTSTPEIQAFHRQEEAWSDVLSIPLAAYQTYLKGMKLTDAILNEAIQVEQDFDRETGSFM